MGAAVEAAMWSVGHLSAEGETGQCGGGAPAFHCARREGVLADQRSVRSCKGVKVVALGERR